MSFLTAWSGSQQQCFPSIICEVNICFSMPVMANFHFNILRERLDVLSALTASAFESLDNTFEIFVGKCCYEDQPHLPVQTCEEWGLFRVGKYMPQVNKLCLCCWIKKETARCHTVALQRSSQKAWTGDQPLLVSHCCLHAWTIIATSSSKSSWFTAGVSWTWPQL